MFAYSQIDPETAGTVDRMYVPLDRYLKSAIEQGWNDSTFNTIRRMEEFHLENGPDAGPMLSPEEANAQYKTPGLEFNAPVRRNQAVLMQQRQQADNERAYYLSQGASGVARSGAGFLAQTIAGMANPLDFAITLMPGIGEERVAANLAKQGLASWRQKLARGFMTVEDLAAAKVPQPHLTASVLNGVIGMNIMELPRAMEATQTNKEFGPTNYLEDMAMAATFAGGIHLASAGLRRLWQRMNPTTKEAMLHKAMNDTMNDADIDVTPVAKLDEAAIHEQVMGEYADSISQSVRSVRIDDVREAIRKEFGEEVKSAAIKYSDGTVKTGDAHFLIEGGDLQDAGAVEGFVTNKGRFVSREAAAELAGFKGHMLNHLNLEDLSNLEKFKELANLKRPLTVKDLVGDLADVHESYMASGRSAQESLDTIKGYIPKKVEQLQNAIETAKREFFQRPDVQAKVEQEYQRRVTEATEQAKKNFDPEKRTNEIRQQKLEELKNAGHTVPETVVKENTHPEVVTDKDITPIKDQVKELENNLKQSNNPEVKKAAENLEKEVMDILGKSGDIDADKAIQIALDCITSKMA